jgi:glycosyltransferase involved in cell wall biosynthesis
MNKISVYIIAYNQIDKIAAAINSVLWADEILVVDSHSTDGTTELALQLGARVIQVPFKGFGDLRNQAIAACKYEWIFSLDSDERCTQAVQAEIRAIIDNPNALDVYHVPRRNYFLGRWIKYSGWYPDYRQPQLFRHDCLRYKLDQVHEGFTMNSAKPLGYLKQAIWQEPYKNLAEMLDKTNRYTSLGVDRLLIKKARPSLFSGLWHGVWAFCRTYFIRQGFLDGAAGFVIAIGSGYSTFFRYAKHYEQSISANKP